MATEFKGKSLTFRFAPHGIENIIESQKSMAQLAQSTQPLISRYIEQQLAFDRIVHQIDRTYISQLADVDFSRTFAAIAESAEQISKIRQSAETFGGLSAVIAQMNESLKSLAETTSIFRFNALIESYSASFHAHNYPEIATGIRSAYLRISEAFRPTTDAFLRLREVATSKSQITSGFEIAVREHFLTSDLLRSMTVVGSNEFEFEDERTEAIVEADEHILLTLPQALSTIDSKLYQIWEGAWESLTSKNPDKIRHTLVSARELLTQVLHALSPDEQVTAWSSAKENFHNGRPTRKGRLRFIYSSVNNSAFGIYLEKDVEACLELCQLLQMGTHGLDVNFTDAQLQVILRRVHSIICALVEVKNATKTHL